MSQRAYEGFKRARRRAKRQAQLGPERAIVRTERGWHVLSCGHEVAELGTEKSHIRRRRCARCLPPTAAVLNEFLKPICSDGLPFFCEGCGAGQSIVPVAGVPGVRGECRECHLEVLEQTEGELRDGK